MSANTGFETGNRVPPVCSPIWEERTRSLLGYLSSPRSIDDIIEWVAVRERSHEWANNMLAWLSITGKAKYDRLSCRWRVGSDPESVMASRGRCQPAGRVG